MRSMQPRQYSFVKFDYSTIPEDFVNQYPFTPTRRYIFLGEIPNMKGHCIVMDTKKSATHYVGYHTENFIELTDDELDTFEP